MLELYRRRAQTHLLRRRVDVGGAVRAEHAPGRTRESIRGIVCRGHTLADEPFAVALGARLGRSAVPAESLSPASVRLDEIAAGERCRLGRVGRRLV